MNKSNSNATTTGTSTLANIYNTDGTINKDATIALLNAVGYIGHESDMGTYTAHNIAGRTSDDSCDTIIFPMGYYVSKDGVMDTSKPIYWQAVYWNNGYLTIWMNNNYTIDYYNYGSSTASGWGNGTSYSQHSNYSKSTLRDITNNIYTALSGKLTNFSTFIKSPSAAGATWQATQTEDIRCYRNSSSGTGNAYKNSFYYYAHHNGLDSYSGMYTGWANSKWNTADTPYNDEFWIPSYYEVYNKTDHTISSSGYISSQDSLWGLTAADRGFKSINNDIYSIEGGDSTNYCFLRSGNSSNELSVVRVNSSGSASYNSVNGSVGVRPACHLSLSAIANALPKLYMVTLDQQGGSGGTESVIAIKDSAMPSITKPTRTGYTFDGYYTSTNGSGTQYYTSSGASARTWNKTSATTLYAKWAANTYYVSYNGNGATSGSMSNSAHTYDTAKALTTNAYSRTGYTFKGWDTSSAGTNVVYKDGASVSNLTSTSGGTVTLYAVWQINSYTISIVSNNADYGTILNTGGTIDYGTTYTTVAAAKTNCAFLYWLDSTNPTVPIYDNPLTITVTADKTYTAYFTDSLAKGIMVTSTIGGSVELLGDDYANLADTDTVTLVARIKITGYQFDGWFIQGESTAFATDFSVRVAYGNIKDKIIVARFSLINSKINTETDNDTEFI